MFVIHERKKMFEIKNVVLTTWELSCAYFYILEVLNVKVVLICEVLGSQCKFLEMFSTNLVKSLVLKAFLHRPWLVATLGIINVANADES